MNEYSKITALYSRLSVGDEDRDGGESNSIVNHETIDSDKTRHISIEIHFNLKPIPEVEQVTA